MSDGPELDLIVDLNTMDDTGLAWAFLDDAPRPERMVPGTYVIAGTGVARAVVRIVDVADGIVHVQPLRGSVASNAAVLTARQVAS